MAVVKLEPSVKPEERKGAWKKTAARVMDYLSDGIAFGGIAILAFVLGLWPIGLIFAGILGVKTANKVKKDLTESRYNNMKKAQVLQNNIRALLQTANYNDFYKSLDILQKESPKDFEKIINAFTTNKGGFQDAVYRMFGSGTKQYIKDHPEVAYKGGPEQYYKDHPEELANKKGQEKNNTNDNTNNNNNVDNNIINNEENSININNNNNNNNNDNNMIDDEENSFKPDINNNNDNDDLISLNSINVNLPSDNTKNSNLINNNHDDNIYKKKLNLNNDFTTTNNNINKQLHNKNQQKSNFSIQKDNIIQKDNTIQKDNNIQKHKTKTNN